MKVAVVGTGYVGLVSGVCLAAKGHQVVCVDLRAEVVAALGRGEPHIHEWGLPELLREVLDAGRFSATTDLAAALEGAEAVLIAVGTPTRDGRIDLDFVGAAAKQIGEAIRTRETFLSVIVKSTVLPGTTDTFVRRIVEEASGKKLGAFGLGMNPEFLREGEAIGDFMDPDRIVFGHEDDATREILGRLYTPWQCEKIAVNCRTAEFIKYANNALLAVQISATNELANLAAALGGVDIAEAMAGVHADRRWNPILPGGERARPGILTYLKAGCGFGGSCFPKDVQALRTLGNEAGAPMRLLQAVLDVNRDQPAQIAPLLAREAGGLAGKRALLLGLAFKPGTDDLRESASFPILRGLREAGADVVVHDPVATPATLARHLGEDGGTVPFASDWEKELAGADVVVVATAWDDYRRLAAPDRAPALAGKILFDARRMFQPGDFPEARYLAIGRTERTP